MNISLTPELDNYVQEKVKTGMYHSASEVIREGLRLLQEQDQIRQSKLGQLRRDIAIGVEQIAPGQYTDYDVDDLEPLLDKIETKVRERVAARKVGNYK